MGYGINVHNVNQGLAEALKLINGLGKRGDSRNGPVLVMPGPVTTTYEDPTARVLFNAERDANPFFHFMEALWMLAGRNDLAFVTQFNAGMARYSDDGRTLHGAYGYRWRQLFLFDQLALIVDELRRNPQSRRAVLTMWSPQDDFNALDGLDVPCNTHAYFDTIDGRLNMTVCCRSNDLWWGCYGANAVHFSMLLEYMAAATNLPIGVYRQFSNNFHLYTNVVQGTEEPSRLYNLATDIRNDDAYTFEYGPHDRRMPLLEGALRRVPMVSLPHYGVGSFDSDLTRFMEEPQNTALYHTPFFNVVVKPMFLAWQAHKAGDEHEAMKHAERIMAGDWSKACVEWLARRNATRQAKLHTENTND